MILYWGDWKCIKRWISRVSCGLLLVRRGRGSWRAGVLVWNRILWLDFFAVVPIELPSRWQRIRQRWVYFCFLVSFRWSPWLPSVECTLYIFPMVFLLVGVDRTKRLGVSWGLVFDWVLDWDTYAFESWGRLMIVIGILSFPCQLAANY